MAPNSRTVLIVDDDQDLRELIAFDFESAGYTTLMASSGNEALLVLRDHQIDAVVSDIRMPDGDGTAIFRQVSAQRKNGLPIFMYITGFSDLSAEQAHQDGVEGFFTKPFGRRVLVSAVERLLLAPAARWSTPVTTPVNADLHIQISSLSDADRDGQIRIGRGGMFVALQGSYPAPGDLIHFEIAASSSPSLTGRGWVRWVRSEVGKGPTGIGVEFQFLDSDSLKAVETLSKNLTSGAFIPRS